MKDGLYSVVYVQIVEFSRRGWKDDAYFFASFMMTNVQLFGYVLLLALDDIARTAIIPLDATSAYVGVGSLIVFYPLNFLLTKPIAEKLRSDPAYEKKMLRKTAKYRVGVLLVGAFLLLLVLVLVAGSN